MIYYAVPVVDITVNDKKFLNRTIYECSEFVKRDGDYGDQKYYTYLEDGTTYYLPEEHFVDVLPTTKLDPRELKDIIYDNHKQRDSDYIKAYKERMGIIVRNYDEEQYLRYKKDDSKDNKNPGQPKDDTL